MVFRSLGVADFCAYAAKAENAGLVQLGIVPGGEPWIALQSRHRIGSPPEIFSALVDILKEEQLKGKSCPSRSVVAASLQKRAPHAVKLAGAKDFRRYCLLAEQAGIIQNGQTKGSEGWISLRAHWLP